MGLNKVPGAAVLVLAITSGCEPRPWQICEENEDCVVFVPDGAAIRRGETAAYCDDHDDCVCGSAELCICPPDTTVVAACREGRCVVGNLDALGLTRCERDADCASAPATCCGTPVRPPDCTTATAVAAVNVAHLDTLASIVCNDDPGCARMPSPAPARCVEGVCRP